MKKLQPMVPNFKKPLESATDGAALAPVPEESQAEAAAAAKALAGVSLARGLAAATHHQLDDGTMRPIAEGPGDAM